MPVLGSFSLNLVERENRKVCVNVSETNYGILLCFTDNLGSMYEIVLSPKMAAEVAALLATRSWRIRRADFERFIGGAPARKKSK